MPFFLCASAIEVSGCCSSCAISVSLFALLKLLSLVHHHPPWIFAAHFTGNSMNRNIILTLISWECVHHWRNKGIYFQKILQCKWFLGSVLTIGFKHWKKKKGAGTTKQGEKVRIEKRLGKNGYEIAWVVQQTGGCVLRVIFSLWQCIHCTLEVLSERGTY